MSSTSRRRDSSRSASRCAYEATSHRAADPRPSRCTCRHRRPVVARRGGAEKMPRRFRRRPCYGRGALHSANRSL
jgi:hypothetical protein